MHPSFERTVATKPKVGETVVPVPHRPDPSLCIGELDDSFDAEGRQRLVVKCHRTVQVRGAEADVVERHPTLPSRLIPRSFCASTANSIGNCFSTSRAKPLTISATALSASSPRLIA